MAQNDDAVTPVSVRFDAPVRTAMRAAARADGCTVSEWLRRAVTREVGRRQGRDESPARQWMSRCPAMCLSLGDGDLWQAQLSNGVNPQGAFVCCDGHVSPEEAAAHGALLAAQAVSAWARALPPGTCGGDLLARAS